jgi:uncharacterized coiled-coil protein SlyX
MKRCPKHYQCIVFESKAAKKRFNDYDYEVQVQLLDRIFKEELKECTCSTCFKIGTLWLNGCETLCKNCDRIEKLERDEKNDKFYLKIARKVIEAKVEMKTADKNTNISEAPITVQINEEKQKEEIIITNEEYNKMKELYEQKERELVYMREHYQKKLEEQEIIHKEIINIKDRRIGELNDTIAQQNISIENGNEYLKQSEETISRLNNQVVELYASIDQTNAGIDLLVKDSQDSCTTSPIVGPIREYEYLVKNAQALRDMKIKADQFNLINFNYIEELQIKAQNYDLINTEMESEKMKLQHLSDLLHNYSTDVGDYEISEELQTFADNLMNLNSYNIEENV